jgi:alpha-amylase
VIEGLPLESRLHFGIEFNFSGMPDGQEDRWFSSGENRKRLGQLGEQLDLEKMSDIELHDQWLGLHCRLATDRPAGIWAFPIRSVSGSEAGFELVHQSVVVIPHWIVVPDSDGRWSVRLTLDLGCEKTATEMEQWATQAGIAQE